MNSTHKWGMSLALSSLVGGLPAASGWAAEEGLAATGGGELAPVLVQGEKPLPTGKAEEGYRIGEADMGPLGNRKAVDTPFSLGSVSADLLRNYGAETFSETVKFLPSTYVEGHLGLEFGPPIIRGMQADDSAGSVRIDGLNVRADTALPQELYEKLEVLGGPASALYGPAPAAGTLNATLKRPTDTPLREAGVFYTDNGNLGARLDLGGRVGEGGALGYRLNVLGADGESYVSGSNQRRFLAGVALDFRLSDRTVVEAKASHYVFDQRGLPGGFSYSKATGLPDAVDASRSGYGQTFGGVDATTDLAELAFHHQLSSDWQIKGAYMDQLATRDFHNLITNTLTSASGTYKTTYRQSGSEARVYSHYLYLNGKAQTGSVGHELSLGTSGYDTDAYTIPGLRSGAALTLGYGSLSDPVTYNDPGWGGTGPKYKASNVHVQSLTLADTLHFNERWSALVAANESWIAEHNWSAKGATTGTYYKDGEWGGSLSLMFKPQAFATVYATYVDSIEPGATAAVGTANEGQSLAPFRSKEWEFGYKAALDRLEWNAALFRIERPFAYTDTDNVFKNAGQQVNEGLELGAKGLVTDRLTVLGNLTYLNPRMDETASSATEGKNVMGVPRLQGTLLGEYRLAAVPGLTLEGDVHYVGRRAANAENSTWAQAYTTLDLGGRYETALAGHKVVGRVMLTNVTDTRYWASINAGWGGTPGQSGTAFLGEPRALRASLSLSF